MPAQSNVVLVLYFVVVITAQKTPGISFISPNVITDIGGDVELRCTISNGKEYPILWMRMDAVGGSGNFPISTGDSLLVKNKRFKLDHDSSSGSYTLKITNIQATDGATYQCQVVVSLNNMITADVKLQVKLPPVILDGKAGSPRQVRVVSGKRSELNCKADGFPNPKITWSREDKHVMPSGKDTTTVPRFIIQKTKMEDRGNYMCTAHNGVGKGVSRMVTLDVEFGPTVSIPFPRVPQAPGYDVKLVCEITAFPAPSIFWKMNESVIDSHDNYKITHFASQGDMTKSTLMMNNVRKEQFGQYTCEATNRYGSAIEKVELYESGIAICPPMCGDNNLSGARSVKAAAWTTAFAATVAIMYYNL